MQRPTFADLAFTGMDARIDPERLQPGQAQLIENFYLSGGSLVSRAGWVGQLTSATGNAIYGLTAYQVSGGTTIVVFASNSKLYKWTVGATSATELTDATTTASFAFASSGRDVRMVRYGKYLYGVDGSGALFRTDTTTAATYAGLTTPTVAPTLALGSAATLVSSPGTATWTQPKAMSSGNYAPTNLSTDPSFANSSAGTTIAAPWSASAGQPTIVAAGTEPLYDGGLKYAELDQNGGAAVPEYLITDAITPPTDGLSAKARIYVLEANPWGEDLGGSTQVLSAEVQLWDTAGTPALITGTNAAQYSTSLTETDSSQQRFLFDWRSITTTVGTAKIRIGAVNGSGNKGLNVNRVNLYSPKQELTLSASGTSLIVRQGTVQVWDGYLLTSGLLLRQAFASANQVWTGKTRAFVDLTADSAVSGLRLRGYLLTGGTTWTAGPVLTATSGGYLMDLTQFSAAVLADVDGFGLEILDDIAVDSLSEGGTASLFTLGSVTEAGNLSSGYAYTYRQSEINVVSGTYPTGDAVESSGSPVSLEILPTSSQAQVSAVLPAATNASATHFLIWREGGVFDDGRWRLLGVFSKTADTSGTGYSWNFTTRTLTDNRPDTALIDATTYQVGRDAFPTGATAIAVHQDRLWLAKNSTLYASWNLRDGQESGIYTTLTPDPEDPYIGTKGASFTLDTSQNPDTVTVLVSFGTILLALRQTVITVVSGFDATNFAANTYLKAAGIGCLARGGAAIVTGVEGNRVWFLAAGGLYEFNGDSVVPVSRELQTLLSQSVIGASYYPYIQLCQHDSRLYCFAPAAGGTSNSLVYVWDTREGGWTRLTTPASVAFTSAVALTGQSDSLSLYVGSSTGQIYAHTGNADKATPAASNVAIPLKLTSRRYGQGQGDEIAWSQGWIQSVDFEATAGATGTLNVLIRNESSQTTNKNYALASGRDAIEVRAFTPIYGVGQEVELTISPTTATTLRRLKVVGAEKGVRRV